MNLDQHQERSLVDCESLSATVATEMVQSMVGSVSAAPAMPSRPAPADKALQLAEQLQRPQRGKSAMPLQQGLRWKTTGFMIAVHLLAAIALAPMFWSWQAVTTLAVLYWITACLGVTIGYHRLLSHRSFRVPHWLERFFATCGALSCQHGPIDWVGLHRHHHRFSDTDADHHNSHRGFWWSHMGWMLREIPAIQAVPRLTSDLAKDPYYCWLNAWFLVLQLPLAALLFWIGTATGVGGWSLVLWGIPLRLLLVYHATWLVNSATHCWGSIAYESCDNSRNNAWVAALTFGEGWHNNHHTFPHSACHGLQPGQVDLTWQHIRLMRGLGLARQIRLPHRNLAG